MLGWRLCRRHSVNPLDGRGARKYGGRWNRKGTPVIYCSSTLSLAALEFLVHGHNDLTPSDLVSILIEWPPSVSSKIVKPEILPRDWQTYPAPPVLQEIGTEWARKRESLLLRVPSVVIPTEENYLLNPMHEEIVRVIARKMTPFNFDPRLMRRGI